MSGSPISIFNDFMSTTGPMYLSSAEAVINEAVANTYAFSRLLKEKSNERMIQGGTDIRDVVMFDDGNTYDHYLPNESFSWQNVQVTDTLSAPWRFSIDHMAWTDQEVELNVGEGSTSQASKVQYKKLKRIKEQRLWTSITNGFENDLWAATDGGQASMEGTAGKLPYSLPAFITENTHSGNTLNGGQRGGLPGDWTTSLMDVDPDTENRWTNHIEFYDPGASSFNAAQVEKTYFGHNAGSWDVGGLFPAFDAMFLKCQFVPPATRQEYFEKPRLNQQMILCSRAGATEYKRALRESNDLLVSPSDPAYNNPTFSGIELMYCSQLDDAALYAKHTSGTQRDAFGDDLDAANYGGTESDGIDPGARYYWVNGAYLTPVFHSRRYFVKHEVMRSPDQPFTHVQPVDCWHNLFCNSRQRHGIVAPLAI